MDRLGVCYFLEANLVPGMNQGTSYFPLACEIENKIAYDDVIKLIVDEGLQSAIFQKDVNENLRREAPKVRCLV